MVDMDRQKKRLEGIVEEGAVIGEGCADEEEVYFEEEETIILGIRCMRRLKARVALSKIADGTYGTCSGCGQEIASERLEVMPEAIFCIRCEERMEKKKEKLVGLIIFI